MAIKHEQTMKLSIVFSLLLVVIFVINESFCAQPDSVFNAYITAVTAGQWPGAESCWLSQTIELSKRLAIRYTEVPAKYDCASPIYTNLEMIRRGTAKLSVDSINFNDDWARLEISIHLASGQTEAIYYAIQADGKWQLTSALYALTRDWKIIDYSYLRIHFANPSMLNDYALSEANGLVESLGGKLAIPEDKLRKLRNEKIDYYLTDDHGIKLLTGFDTKGMANLQYDAVVTQYLPHPHETVHLLINYDLQELPLYTIPFMQEGLATYLGGRWGKAPEVIFYLGEVNLAMGMAKLEDILTYGGFQQDMGSSDIAYALSGIFAKYLVENYSMDKFKMLYRELSVSNSQIAALTLSDIKSKIVKLYGVAWDEMESDFTRSAKNYEYCGLKPEKVSEDKSTLVLLNDKNIQVKISENQNSYQFSAKSSIDMPGGTILFVSKSSQIDNHYQSRLFAEQKLQTAYTGEIYGLQFNPDEAGFYNYYTNMLLAKYVSGFSPSADYWNPTDKKITFSLNKSLLEGKIEEYDIKLAISP